MVAPSRYTPTAAKIPFEIWAFSFWGLLVGAPLSGVMVVLAIHTQDAIADIALLPSNAARGPSLFEGTLSTTRPVRTHLGADVGGWVGEVRSVVSHGKSSTRTTLCSVGHLDGMILTLDGSHERLRLVIPDYHVNEGHLDLLTAVVTRGRPQRLLRGEIIERDEVPAAMLNGCALRPVRERERRTYIEHQFRAGERVTFLGCRNGNSLDSCVGDEVCAGHLLKGTRVELLGDLLMSSVVTHALVTLVSVFFSFVASWTVWGALRRYQNLGLRPW